MDTQKKEQIEELVKQSTAMFTERHGRRLLANYYQDNHNTPNRKVSRAFLIGLQQGYAIALQQVLLTANDDEEEETPDTKEGE
jgi:hypothetical protein